MKKPFGKSNKMPSTETGATEHENRRGLLSRWKDKLHKHKNKGETAEKEKLEKEKEEKEKEEKEKGEKEKGGKETEGKEKEQKPEAAESKPAQPAGEKKEEPAKVEPTPSAPTSPAAPEPAPAAAPAAPAVTAAGSPLAAAAAPASPAAPVPISNSVRRCHFNIHRHHHSHAGQHAAPDYDDGIGTYPGQVGNPYGAQQGVGGGGYGAQQNLIAPSNFGGMSIAGAGGYPSGYATATTAIISPNMAYGTSGYVNGVPVYGYGPNYRLDNPHCNPQVALAFGIIFLFFSLFHMVQMFRFKHWIFAPFFLGLGGMGVGFLLRVASLKKPHQELPFLAQFLILLIAPSLIISSIYLLLCYLLKLRPRTPKLTLLPRKWLSFALLSSLLISTCLLSLGGVAVATSAPTEPNHIQHFHKYEPIITAGAVLQTLTLLFFTYQVALFHTRENRYYASAKGRKLPDGFLVFLKGHGRGSDWHVLLGVLYFAIAVLLVRSIFRVAEFMPVHLRHRNPFATGYATGPYGTFGSQQYADPNTYAGYNPQAAAAGITYQGYPGFSPYPKPKLLPLEGMFDFLDAVPLLLLATLLVFVYPGAVVKGAVRIRDKEGY